MSVRDPGDPLWRRGEAEAARIVPRPNPELIKGETSCNREACQADLLRLKERGLGRWWNTSTRKWYCPCCAAKINRACFDYNEPYICFEEGSKSFLDMPKEEAP